MSDSRWRETSQRVQVFSSSAATGLLSVNPLLCLDRGLIVEVEVKRRGCSARFGRVFFTLQRQDRQHCSHQSESAPPLPLQPEESCHSSSPRRPLTPTSGIQSTDNLFYLITVNLFILRCFQFWAGFYASVRNNSLCLRQCLFICQ